MGKEQEISLGLLPPVRLGYHLNKLGKKALKRPLKFVQNKLDNDTQGLVIYQFSMTIEGSYQMGLCRIKLHPLLSSTFTNEVHDVTENSLVKFQDNIRSGL